MPRIGRYLFREALGPCLTGFLVFTILLVINLLFQIAELAIRQRVSAAVLGEFLLLALPSILVLTVPMSVLLGILVGMGRLSAEGEVTALRACGVSFNRMAPPLVVLGLLGTTAAGYASLVLVPEANYLQHRLNAEIFFAGDLHRNIQPRVFYQGIPGLLLYAQDVGDDDGLRDVLLYQRTPDGQGQLTLAKRARIEAERESGRIEFYLEEGETHVLDPARPDRYQRSRFRTQVLLRPPDPATREFVATLRGPLPRNLREMTTPDLLAEVSSLRAGAADASRKHGLLPAQLELHRRFALPLAATILSLLGLPLGVVVRRGGRSSGFALSLAVILAYWLLLSGGENLARTGAVPPWAAIWLPNGAFLLLGGALLAWQSRDRRLPRAWTAARDALSGIGSRLRARRPAARRAAPAPSPSRPWSGLGGVTFPGRIDRYVSAHYGRSLVLVLGAFYILYLLADLRTLLDDIAEHGASAVSVVRYLAFASPAMIHAGLPLAALLATLIALGLLERRNEVTALKAAGVSLYRIAVPLLGIGALVGGLQFVLSDAILPEAGRQAAALRAEIRDVQPASGFAARRWVFGADRRLYYLASYSPSLDEYQGVAIFRFAPDRFAIVERIEAAAARYTPEGWVLRSGWERRFENGGETFRRFEEERVPLPETPDYLNREVRAPSQMSYQDLREAIADLERGGYDVRELKVAFHEKAAMACVPFVLVLLGLPFAVRAGRGGALAGIGLAMTLVVAYYICLATFRQLGAVGALPPPLAAWSPSALFGLAGLYRMRSIRT